MKGKIAALCLAISLALGLHLASLERIAFSRDFYEKELSRSSIKDDLNVSEGLIGFFRGKNELPPVFDEKESSHLGDVKMLILKGEKLLLVLSLANIILLSLALFYSQKSLGKMLLFSGIFALAMMLPLVFCGFSSLFTKFHHVFFPMGNWQFSQGSLLIRLFPQQFFYSAFARAAASSSLAAAALILAGILLSRAGSD